MPVRTNLLATNQASAVAHDDSQGYLEIIAAVRTNPVPAAVSLTRIPLHHDLLHIARNTRMHAEIDRPTLSSSSWLCLSPSHARPFALSPFLALSYRIASVVYMRDVAGHLARCAQTKRVVRQILFSLRDFVGSLRERYLPPVQKIQGTDMWAQVCGAKGLPKSHLLALAYARSLSFACTLTCTHDTEWAGSDKCTCSLSCLR